MMMLYPDGSVQDWPEWASTVPQDKWDDNQRAFMLAHQQRMLKLQRNAETVTGGQ